MNASNSSHMTLNLCFGVFRSVCVHLGSFHRCTKLGAKRGEMVKLMQRFVSRSRFIVFRTIAPDSPHCTLNSCFDVFCSVWVHLGPFHYYMKLSVCNYCKSLCHEVMSEFFTKNAPYPRHLTLNLCFGAFHSVCMHFESFHYCMKHGAKLAELVQLMQ